MDINQQYDSGGIASIYSQISKVIESTDPGRKFLKDSVSTRQKNSVIFDVGCGSGLDLVAYSKMGFLDLYGIDPSETFLEEAKQNIGNVAHILKGTFEQMPLA